MEQKLQFVLQTFSETAGKRVFVFEGIAPDWTRTVLSVSADLTLARKYGIRLQELPLLCRTVLEQSYDGGTRTFSYTEDEMRIRADAAAARELAATRKRPPRRPVNGAQVAPNRQFVSGNRPL